jgi:hypothetical protein
MRCSVPDTLGGGPCRSCTSLRVWLNSNLRGYASWRIPKKGDGVLEFWELEQYMANSKFWARGWGGGGGGGGGGRGEGPGRLVGGAPG